MFRKDTRIVNLGRGAALLLGLAGAMTAHAGTPSFAAQQAFAAGSAPTLTVSADLNGDGQPDLITTDVGNNALVVSVSSTTSGATTANFVAQQTIPVEATPWSIAVADVNGDGKPDLIVVYQIGNAPLAVVSVLINTTLPGATSVSFAPAQDFATGNGGFPWVAAADLDGDGKPDLIVANDMDGTVSVLLNTTTAGSLTASFAAQQVFSVGNGPVGIVVGDLNGDGLQDLAVTNSGDSTVSVLLNTTSGGVFSLAPQQVFSAGVYSGGIAIGDLNGDGMPDLVLANYGGSAAVSVLLNTTPVGSATMSFSPEQSFGSRNPGPLSVAVADLNDDGKADVVYTDFSGSQVWVLPNTTSPGSVSASFGAPVSFATGSAPYTVTTVDINGDGQMDLVAANMGDASLSVLLNGDAASASAMSMSIVNSGSLQSSACKASSPTAKHGAQRAAVKSSCNVKPSPAHGTVKQTGLLPGGKQEIKSSK